MAARQDLAAESAGVVRAAQKAFGNAVNPVVRSIQPQPMTNDPAVDFTDLLRHVEHADRFLQSLDARSDDVLRHINDVLQEVEAEWSAAVDEPPNDTPQQKETTPSNNNNTNTKP